STRSRQEAAWGLSLPWRQNRLPEFSVCSLAYRFSFPSMYLCLRQIDLQKRREPLGLTPGAEIHTNKPSASQAGCAPRRNVPAKERTRCFVPVHQADGLQATKQIGHLDPEPTLEEALGFSLCQMLKVE